MSRDFATLSKKVPVDSQNGAGDALRPAGPPLEFSDLVQRLFQNPCVVAIICSGAATARTGVCQRLGAELGRIGKRVVLVSVSALLHSGSVAMPDKTGYAPGPARSVWLWPPPSGEQIALFRSRTPSGVDDWLNTLRRNFDSVLLDCAGLDSTPGMAKIAGMADAAVLAVQGGEKTKQQILRDQCALEANGVRFAGCILVNGK